MPLQNRVHADGFLHRTASRGTFTGNRGIIHNDDKEVVKLYTSKAWIICLLDFQGRRRQVMSKGRWTELFFLDEATALSAGHRPCFYCRREDAKKFQAAWSQGNCQHMPDGLATVKVMDGVMHAERLGGGFYQRNKTKRVFSADISTLPDGTMIAIEKAPHLIWHDALYAWSFDGYGPAQKQPNKQMVQVLTPPSTVAALRHGFVPQVHPTLGRASSTKHSTRSQIARPTQHQADKTAHRFCDLCN